MPEYYLSKPIANCTSLCISPLTDEQIEASLPLTKANQYAYYLYERDHAQRSAEISILARLVSEEAAVRLGQLLEME